MRYREREYRTCRALQWDGGNTDAMRTFCGRNQFKTEGIVAYVAYVYAGGGWQRLITGDWVYEYPGDHRLNIKGDGPFGRQWEEDL